jgi:hypothetical protein
MMSVSIEGDNAVIADLGNMPEITTRAMVRAMNRAMASARTVMVRAVAADTGLTATAVRSAMTLREATFDRPEARLATTMKRIPLIDFRARGPEPSRGKGRGVSYRLPHGRGRHPNAFIATMKSGHRGVFVRRGKGRLPIQELFGPSLGHVFAKYRPQGMQKLQEAFDSNFDHELQFAKERELKKVLNQVS